MPSLFDLTGKTAIITGSSKGIGKAIAERFVEHGANVVISSRKLPACEEVANALNAKAGRKAAIAVGANISSRDELQKLVDETVKAFGRIDILVCNAASNPYYGSLTGISDDQFRKILENNIISNNTLATLTLPHMEKTGAGSIIVISSIGALRGSSTLGAYGISKAADIQLVRSLALEHGKNNIRANCIAPGLVKTDFAKALWDNPETLKRSNTRTPLGRIGEPDEIAGAAVFLASKAGAFVSGQTIVIDGGQTST